MNTRISLKKYEDMYDSFDSGHDRQHFEEVRSFSLMLAEKYCPSKMEIVYVAATLHDIGISISRDNHEKDGYEILLKDQNLKDAYSKEEYDEILEAVREHRASTGNPQSIVAKIISDADKVGHDTKRVFTRTYGWEKANSITLSHQELLLRAAQHLKGKFGEGGSGTRLYFEESREKIKDIFTPIFKALEENDLQKLETFILS